MDSDLLSNLIDDPVARAQAGAEDMVNAALDRIARIEPQIKAFISMRAERALEEARALDARRAHGEAVGALAGLPVAVKDNIDVADSPATAGSSFLVDHIPGSDAEVVRRMRNADAVVIGKTALHEFAYGVTTNNPHHGPTRNPWATDRIPGGSSGGSGAALGADCCILALGTDTGGSVRIPAALNGVSSLRPTHGSVSTRGTVPVSALLDTVGPMARSMRDVALLHSVITGYDRADPWAEQAPTHDAVRDAAEGLGGLRIAIAGGFFAEEVEPDVAAAVHVAAEQLAALGAEVSEREFPGAEDAVAITTRLVLADALMVHRERLESNPDGFGEDVRRRLELGRAVTGVDAMHALTAMRNWRARMLERFEEIDLIITPTTPRTAPLIADSEMIATTALLTRFTYPWSLALLPAGSIPCGIDRHGLPVGLQLIAAPWNDRLILQAGTAYQEATDWHLRRPALAAGRPVLSQ